MMKQSSVSMMKRILSLCLVATIVLSIIASADIFYPTDYAQAANFKTSGGGVTAPAYNASNFPTLDTTGTGSSLDRPTRNYYFGKDGNAFYGVTNGAASGYWELVDTDAMLGGTKLYSIWGEMYNGQPLLDNTNGFATTYFNEADRVVMKATDVSIDNSFIARSETGLGTGAIRGARMWPLSIGQYSISELDGSAKNGLSYAISSNSWDDIHIWTRSFYIYFPATYDYRASARVWAVENTRNYDNTIYELYGAPQSRRVAPAFNLDLNRVLLARSASSASGAQSFATASANAVAGSASGDLKFLVNAGTVKSGLTSGIAGKNIINAFAGMTYSVDYSNASTSVLNSGTNYVSAILYDTSGKVAYYGNLGQINATNGNVSFTVPSGLAGTYTLALFQEEKCAAYKTDYASNPVYATMTIQTVNYETEGSIRGETLRNTTQGTNVSNNSSVEVGDVLTTANLSGFFSNLTGESLGATVYLTTSLPSGASKVNTTSVTVPSGSSTLRVYAVIYPSHATGIPAGYVSKEFNLNVNYEASTGFSQKDPARATLQVNDTFKVSEYTGIISWVNGIQTQVAESDLYIVPAAVWEGWNDLERTKANVTALSAYGNGKSITVDSAELNGADTYSFYTVYFPAHSGAAAYHANKWTYTSTSLYATKIEAAYTVSAVDYGDLITNSDIQTTVILSGTNNFMKAGQIYVLPKSIWDELDEETQKSESKLKKVTGINSVVIPSESDLGDTEKYELAVVYFDYSEQNRAGDNGTECDGCTRFETTVSIPLVSSVEKDYLSYTSSGVTWYYQLELNENLEETGYAVNVHTTNEDVRQYIDTDGVLNIPEEVNGYKVKSIGSGTKDRPFVPANVDAFTNIRFPATVSDVNDYAFYANTAFMRLVIPASVQNIGNFAFYDNDNISSVTIHSTVIGTAAFGNCDGITEVFVDGTGYIGKVAFAENKNLRKVTISETNSIGKSAFANNVALNALNLKGLRNAIIHEYAFKDCRSIMSLHVPETNQVKAYAFDGCSGITNLELDITTVENHSFEGCFFIQYMVFGPHVNVVEYDWGGYSNDLYENNDHYTEKLDTVIYVKNKNTLFECYREGSDIYSSFMGHYVEGGSYKYSRIIDTYVSGEGTTANTHSVDGTRTSATLAYYAAAAHDMAETTYSWWDYVTAKDLLTVTMHTDANTGDANVTLEPKRDGITAYYDGKIYDVDAADKDKVIVKPTYSDATQSSERIRDFYFYDEAEADVAIRDWIKNTDYAFKNVISGKLIENQVYRYSKYVEYCNDTATITKEELEYETKAMIAAIFNDKESFLAATAGIVDKPSIQPVTSNQGYNIQHMKVIYYPSEDLSVDPDYNVGETGDVTYYLAGFDVKTVKYTAEQGFFDQGFTYSNVMERMEELNERIRSLSEEIVVLTEQRDLYQTSSDEYQKKLQKAYQELAEYTNLYHNIVAQLNEYLGTTEVASDKYFGTKTDNQGHEVPVVWINGVELPYTAVKSDGINQDTFVDGNGSKYPVYSVTGDIDGDGNSKYYEFYVASDGVHIIVIGNGESREDVRDRNIIYDETVRALQRDITARLIAIREELATVRNGMDELRGLLTGSYLNYPDEEWETLSDKERLGAITSAVDRMQRDYDELSNRLLTSQNTVQSLNQVLAVLNKIGAGSTVTSDELTLLSGIEAYADLDQLVKMGSESSESGEVVIDDTPFAQSDLEEYVNQLATIIQNGCADHPDTEANEYGVYDQDTLRAVASYSSVISSVLEGMSNEITTLRATVSTQLTTIATQTQTIADKQAQIDALQAGNIGDAYTAAQTEIASLNNRLEGLSYEVEELSNHVLSMQSELNTLKTLLASVRALLGVEVDADILKAIQGLQDTIQANLKKNDQMQERLSLAEGTIQKIQAQLSTTATGEDLVELVGKNKVEYMTEASGHSSGVNDNSVIYSLTSQISAISAQNRILAEENNSLKEDNVSLQKEKGSLEKSVIELRQKNGSLVETQNALRKANDKLNQMVEAAVETVKGSDKNKESTPVAATSTTDDLLEQKNIALNLENRLLKQQLDSLQEQRSNKQLTANNSIGSSQSLEKKNQIQSVNSNLEVQSKETDVSEPIFKPVSSGLSKGIVSRSIPEDTGKAAITGNVIVTPLDANMLYADDFSTNGASHRETTSDQKDRANLMFSYYGSHLEELIDLGADEIMEAVGDETKIVHINAIGSFEILESQIHTEAFDNGSTALVEIAGQSLVDNATYLVIHESSERPGIYDVILTKADNGKLMCELEDLSPLSIAELKVLDEALEFVTNQDNNVLPQQEADQIPSNGTLKTVFIVLISIAVVGIVFVCLLIQKRRVRS